MRRFSFLFSITALLICVIVTQVGTACGQKRYGRYSCRQPHCCVLLDGARTRAIPSPIFSTLEPFRLSLSSGYVSSTQEGISPLGFKHRVLLSKDKEAQAVEEHANLMAATPRKPFPDFGGKARKTAKTIFAQGPLEDFESLHELLADLRKTPDSFMKIQMRNAGVRKGVDSDRINLEKRNVQVIAFLYASSLEDDNDFHLILGNGQETQEFFNVEVSGLPDGSTRTALETVRRQYEQLHRDHHLPLPNGSGYQFYDPPLAVIVIGSLFYDNDHQPGQVGPEEARPTTSWEIHPVRDIRSR